MLVFFNKLQIRLLALVLLAVIPALGFTVVTGLEQRRQADEEARMDTLVMLRGIIHNQQEVISNTRDLLITLSLIPQVRSGGASCPAFLAAQTLQRSTYASFAVVDPNGNVICASSPLKYPVNLAILPWITLANTTRGFVAGSYHVDEVSGRSIIPIVYPILDSGGRVETILVANIDLLWLNHQAATVELPQGGVLTIVDRFGTILVRHPASEKWVGRQLLLTFIERP